MADSALVTKYIPAYKGNYTANRSRYSSIKEIAIHHCAANTSIASLGALWQKVGRNGSSHYGINGTQVGQYVLEKDIAWTNSNWDSNCRAVTIEVANSSGAPGWKVSDASINTLVHLVADIAKRHNLIPLVLGKNVTWHSMYAATQCPGPYLYSRLGEIVKRANEEINASMAPSVPDFSAEVSKEVITGEAVITVGPASSGDVASLRVIASNLGLKFVENNGVMTIGPMSRGDQGVVLTRCKELLLPYTLKKYPFETYAVTADGFPSKEDADVFAAECQKKNLTTTVTKTS